MAFVSTAALRSAGFVGFLSVRELAATRLSAVPDVPGVYVVVREAAGSPVFLASSPAGHFKGRDPTLPKQELERAWVAGTCVVYIGKAGGAGTDATLRERLRCFLSFGRGARAAHWGGRATWQLADAADLLIAWRPTADEEPRDVERGLIADFVAQYGQRPIANRTG